MRCRAHICSGLVCLREKILIMRTFWFFSCLHVNDYFCEFTESLIVWICVCHSYLVSFDCLIFRAVLVFTYIIILLRLHPYFVLFYFELGMSLPMMLRVLEPKKLIWWERNSCHSLCFIFVSKNELGTEIPIMLPPSGEMLIGWGRKPLALLRCFVFFQKWARDGNPYNAPWVSSTISLC